MKAEEMKNGFYAGSMTITAIEPVKRNVYKVFLNGEPAMRLTETEINTLHLSQDMDMTYEQYEKICELVLLKKAKLRCLDILTARDKTERELLRILRMEDYPEHVAQAALLYVKQFRYVDDARYALQYIEAKSTSRSRAQISMMLREKGIRDELIEQAFAQATQCDQAALIRKLAEKKHFNPAAADEIEKRRFYQSLIRKGFSYHEILDAFRDE